MKKSLKGMLAMSVLVKYIIAIASLVILVLFMNLFLGGMESESLEQVCRSSVIARDKVELGKAKERILPLNCPTEDVTLPLVSFQRLNTTEQRLEFQKEIADLAVKCWWMFGNGDVSEIFSRKDENVDGACHHCYTFYIPPRYAQIDPDDPHYQPPLKENISFSTSASSEFLDYLLTHNYEPGLLQGGGAVLGTAEIYDFNNQTDVRSAIKRPLTRERLFAGKKTLDYHLADFSDIYTYEETLDLAKVSSTYGPKANLKELNDIYSLEIAFVIVPELVGEDFEEYNNLPLELLKEWQIGSPELLNGILFIFSLKDGKILYGSQVGANAVLAKGTIEALLDEASFYEIMEGNTVQPYTNGGPADAIASFAYTLNEYVKGKGSATVKASLEFQRSYYAYMTGGAIGATFNVKNPNKVTVNAQGEFKSADIVAGKRYAVIFHSADHENDVLDGKDLSMATRVSIRELEKSICKY